MRLGNSFAALKANPWFDNFDWVILKINIIQIYYCFFQN